MAGCYGNDPFDRYWESKLHQYLDEYEECYEEEDESNCLFCDQPIEVGMFCSKECAKAWDAE